MRLWSEQLFGVLCQQHLLGQHREVCALRGKGWGKNHETVDYVFDRDPAYLVEYHLRLMDEMQDRGISPNEKWRNPFYRGKQLGKDQPFVNVGVYVSLSEVEVVYPEHDTIFTADDIRDLQERSADPDSGCHCEVEQFQLDSVEVQA